MQIKLPVVESFKPKVEIPLMDIESVDLRDLEDWWYQEGKYA